jgi:hypothetical protein
VSTIHRGHRRGFERSVSHRRGYEREPDNELGASPKLVSPPLVRQGNLWVVKEPTANFLN